MHYWMNKGRAPVNDREEDDSRFRKLCDVMKTLAKDLQLVLT